MLAGEVNLHFSPRAEDPGREVLSGDAATAVCLRVPRVAKRLPPSPQMQRLIRNLGGSAGPLERCIQDRSGGTTERAYVSPRTRLVFARSQHYALGRRSPLARDYDGTWVAEEVVGPRERPKEGTTPVVKRPASAAGSHPQLRLFGAGLP